jgi:hypothetical protein
VFAVKEARWHPNPFLSVMVRKILVIFAKFMNFLVHYFDLLCSPILIPLFQSFMTGSEGSGLDHVTGESASSTLAVVQITVGSIKLCLSLSEVDFCHTLWNETSSIV